MQVKKRWVVFYSQTGSEIKSLIEDGFVPDLVITDNFTSHVTNCDYFNKHGIKQIVKSFKGTKQYKIKLYNRYLDDNDLVTLHGWLNIVPGSVCERFTIYNGHPGHIVLYPELKGKDPQVRVWEDITSNRLPDKIGSVVHRVTEEVDGGEVVVVSELLCNNVSINSVDEVFNINSNLSRASWDCFFRNLHIILKDELNLDGTSDREKHIPIIFSNHE